MNITENLATSKSQEKTRFRSFKEMYFLFAGNNVQVSADLTGRHRMWMPKSHRAFQAR